MLIGYFCRVFIEVFEKKKKNKFFSFFGQNKAYIVKKAYFCYIVEKTLPLEILHSELNMPYFDQKMKKNYFFSFFRKLQ